MIKSLIDDRRAVVAGLDPSIEDHRVAETQRRKSPRTRTLKGAQIVRRTGGPVKCVVRDISEGGACLEVHGPIPPNDFDLIFDSDQSRHACTVVWRQPPRMGVKFR
ncbi:MAG: PilZ domain-containing protein [Methylovirgula sp.]